MLDWIKDVYRTHDSYRAVLNIFESNFPLAFLLKPFGAQKLVTESCILVHSVFISNAFKVLLKFLSWRVESRPIRVAGEGVLIYVWGEIFEIQFRTVNGF